MYDSFLNRMAVLCFVRVAQWYTGIIHNTVYNKQR
jgi:hypothetical protein